MVVVVDEVVEEVVDDDVVDDVVDDVDVVLEADVVEDVEVSGAVAAAEAGAWPCAAGLHAAISGSSAAVRVLVRRNITWANRIDRASDPSSRPIRR